jgi:hypothetical protein
MDDGTEALTPLVSAIPSRGSFVLAKDVPSLPLSYHI